MADHTETFPPAEAGHRPAASEASEQTHARTRMHTETLGPYQLLFRIGGGGMADVWVAIRHGGFGFQQHFAVKTIRAELGARAAFRTMFLNEARLASRVRHTNVVPVLDLGEDHGVVYQAMPLVDGGSVAALVRALGDRPMPLEAVLRIAVDAARGLHAAHESKDEDGKALHIVHCDVSPQNILVGTDGVAKVADFGIAKALGTASGDTSSDNVKGKRAYLSPEQLQRQGTDRRADVFALGVVLWELLTGRRCFPTGDSAMFFSLAKRVDDVRTIRSTIPDPIAAVVACAVEAERDARFPTSEALADALEAAARACGVTPSAKQAGSLVTELLGSDIVARERAIAETNVEIPVEIATAPIVTNDSVNTPPHKRSRVVVAAAALVLVAVPVGIALLTFRPAHERVGVAGELAAPGALPDSPPLASPPLASTPAASTPAALPVETPVPATSEARPEDRVGGRRHPAPKARPTSAPKPKFSENPYAR